MRSDRDSQSAKRGSSVRQSLWTSSIIQIKIFYAMSSRHRRREKNHKRWRMHRTVYTELLLTLFTLFILVTTALHCLNSSIFACIFCQGMLGQSLWHSSIIQIKTLEGMSSGKKHETKLTLFRHFLPRYAKVRQIRGFYYCTNIYVVYYNMLQYP